MCHNIKGVVLATVILMKLYSTNKDGKVIVERLEMDFYHNIVLRLYKLKKMIHLCLKVEVTYKSTM